MPNSSSRFKSLSFSTPHISQMPSRMGYHSSSMVVGLLTRAEHTSTVRNKPTIRRMGCPFRARIFNTLRASTLTAPDSVTAPVRAITQMICWMVALPNQLASRPLEVLYPQIIRPNRPIMAGQKVSPVAIVIRSTPKNTPKTPTPTSVIPAKGGTTTLNRKIKHKAITTQR